MQVDERGVAHGATLHDALRWLIRGGTPNTEANQRHFLLAVDAHEQGYPDADSWEAELQKRAEAARAEATVAVVSGESESDKLARLEAALDAANARIESLANAAAGNQTQRPAQPASTT